MRWEIYDPFSDMRNLHKEMDRAFRGMYNRPVPKGKPVRQPLADIKETKTEVIAEIELPGVSKEDIELNVTENMLSVKAQKKQEVKQEKEGYSCCERSYSSFQRAFSLPSEVVAAKASAKFENGLLKVNIPKAKPQVEENKVNKIDIQ